MRIIVVVILVCAAWNDAVGQLVSSTSARTRSDHALLARRVEVLKEKLIANSNSAADWLALGRVYQSAGYYRESIAPLQRAMQLGANREEDLARLIARAFLKSGNEKQAQRWTEYALLSKQIEPIRLMSTDRVSER